MAYRRENRATEAHIDKSKLFASGAFKNVYAGVYVKGTRAGQKCVAKEFKSSSAYENSYFDEELSIIRRTQSIIDDWNEANIIDRPVLLNIPEIWHYEGSGKKYLVEAMIENFEKFNSNSGWVNTSGGVWSDALQALSHFSYHSSRGRYLLCDVQGGSYRDGYILTDPVIMSESRTYGPTDLGPDGICAFFRKHECGRFCRRHWRTPENRGGPTVPTRMGTQMVAHLPTRHTRNILTHGGRRVTRQ